MLTCLHVPGLPGEGSHAMRFIICGTPLWGSTGSGNAQVQEHAKALIQTIGLWLETTKKHLGKSVHYVGT